MKHQYLIVSITALTACAPAHMFWDDFDFDLNMRELMDRPRRWISKNMQDAPIQSISNCAVSSNDQEVVISVNLLQAIQPAAIKSQRSGDTVTISIPLGTQQYQLIIRASGHKLSYSFAVQQQEQKDINEPDIKSHSSSRMSSLVQQAFPADVDLAGVAIELDGAMLHVHIPRATTMAPQEIPLKVRSRPVSTDK